MIFPTVFYYILPLNCKHSENPNLMFVPQDVNSDFTPQRKRKINIGFNYF
jgi:hypothetical protein